MASKFLFIALIAIIALGIIFTPSALAQDLSNVKILPGSFWYPFKLLYEDIITLFTFDDLSLVKRYLELAERRLAEIKKLEESDNCDQIKKTLARYQRVLQKAKEAVVIAKQNGRKADEILEKAVETANKNTELLQSVYDNIPDELKDTVKNAINSTEGGKKDWINALKLQVSDQLFNQGRENEKGLKELNNELKDNIVPKMPNLNNVFR